MMCSRKCLLWLFVVAGAVLCFSRESGADLVRPTVPADEPADTSPRLDESSLPGGEQGRAAEQTPPSPQPLASPVIQDPGPGYSPPPVGLYGDGFVGGEGPYGAGADIDRATPLATASELLRHDIAAAKHAESRHAAGSAADTAGGGGLRALPLVLILVAGGVMLVAARMVRRYDADDFAGRARL